MYLVKDNMTKYNVNLEDNKAAGTPIKVTVTFECEKLDDYKDEFIV